MNAIDLINKVLHFVCFCERNIDEWYIEKLSKKPPVYIRFQQVDALLQAFGFINTKGFKSQGLIDEKLCYTMDRQVQPHIMTNVEYFISGNSLPDNSPVYVRFRQIEPLLQAFGFINKNRFTSYGLVNEKGRSFTYGQDKPHIMTNIEYFISGNSLPDRPISLAQLMTSLSKVNPSIFNGVRLSYLDLFRYRMSIHPYTHPRCWGTWEEFDVNPWYYTEPKKPLLKKLRENLFLIDKVLSSMIDPAQRNFSVDELKEKYNYPEVDLEKIDREFIAESFIFPYCNDLYDNIQCF
jgi:hypothetical protein